LILCPDDIYSRSTLQSLPCAFHHSTSAPVNSHTLTRCTWILILLELFATVSKAFQPHQSSSDIPGCPRRNSAPRSLALRSLGLALSCLLNLTSTTFHLHSFQRIDRVLAQHCAEVETSLHETLTTAPRIPRALSVIVHSGLARIHPRAKGGQAIILRIVANESSLILPTSHLDTAIPSTTPSAPFDTSDTCGHQYRSSYCCRSTPTSLFPTLVGLHRADPSAHLLSLAQCLAGPVNQTLPSTSAATPTVKNSPEPHNIPTYSTTRQLPSSTQIPRRLSDLVSPLYLVVCPCTITYAR
jgi:hypothetical protein